MASSIAEVDTRAGTIGGVITVAAEKLGKSRTSGGFGGRGGSNSAQPARLAGEEGQG